jgi:hypothetical protein
MGVLFLSLIANALIVLVSLFFLFKKRGTGKSPFRNPFYWLTAIIAVPVSSGIPQNPITPNMIMIGNRLGAIDKSPA